MRETVWILKLRTVYPYGVNEKVDICKNDKNVKESFVGKFFPSLPRLFQRNQIFSHDNRKGIFIFKL